MHYTFCIKELHFALKNCIMHYEFYIKIKALLLVI